ncbi:uncharacterized protein LOC144650828 isoform X2 [Oculina patagonica]
MESISTSCLINLAFDLSGDWKKLARVLGLADVVERIGEDYKRNVFEQAYRMLRTWMQRNGSLATYQVLGEALRKPVLSRNDLAQKYCEGENRGSSNTVSLQGRLRSVQVSGSDMVSISNDLGKNWLWVGRLLGLEDTALDDIREAHTQMYECSYQMLELWASKNCGQATYEWLARALLHRTVGMRDVAEKYCLEHRESESASHVPSEEGIQPLNEKMKKLDLGGPHANESGATASLVHVQSNTKAETVNKTETGTRPSLPPVPDDCIAKNFITVLPYKIWRELIIKLDPLRELQGDYRDLASELGFNVEMILYFQSLKNPTEAVLTESASKSSIEELCNKLEAIGRSDARLLIDKWVKSRNCKCAACVNFKRVTQVE